MDSYQPIPPRLLSPSKNNNLITTLFIILLSLSLLSCGGGSSGTALPPPPPELNSCSTTQLQVSGGGCIDVVEINLDKTPAADGLDLTNNTIPELVYISPTQPLATATGVDFNGDNNIDYYLLIDVQGKKSLHTTSSATSQLVTIITNSNGEPIGFNTGNSPNNTDLKKLLNNKIKPTILITPLAGKYQQAPNISVSCNSIDTTANTNYPCNSLSYSLDNNIEPTFLGNGTIIYGSAISTQQLSLAKDSSGNSVDGIYSLQIIARTAAGITTLTDPQTFEIDSTACQTPPQAIITTSAIPATINNQLVKNASNATSNTFTLDGSLSKATPATTEIVRYSWQQIILGDEGIITKQLGSTATLKTFITPERVTTVRYSLTVTDQFGCTSAPTETTLHVMEDPQAALFVDSTITNGTGTRTEPFKTIQEAIDAAKSQPNNTPDLYISNASGVVYNEKSLIIPTGMSLYGGFNSDWSRDVVNKKTKLFISKDITTDPTPHLIGLDFQRLNNDAWLTGFNISTQLLPTTASSESNIFAVHAIGEVGNAATLTIQRNIINAGDALDGNGIRTGSSYGVYVTTISTLQIDNNLIISGTGGTGSNGINGLNGQSGQAGTNGEDSVCYFNGQVPPNPNKAGGVGGSSSNKALEGKVGGFGGHATPNLINGEDGFGLCAGTGGLSFYNSDVNAPPSPLLNATPVKIRELNSVCQLVDLIPTHNSFAGSMIGNFDLGYYIPSNGSNGKPGKEGAGGSGGGGGGANIFAIVSYNGSGGGGGGAAGEAGGAGIVGLGGGASISLYVNNSGSIINNNILTAANGGSALTTGNGGIGGLGGKAGQGGSVGQPFGDAATCGDFAGGTAGQDGTSGGNGGDASGSGGGPSIGIYINSTQALEITKNTITTSNGGNGGNARHGAAGDGGVSYGLYADNGSVLPTLTGNTIIFGQPGLGGIINQDTTTNSPGTGTPGLSGNSDIKNF